MIEILQETTDWGKKNIANGIYHVNSAGQLVQYFEFFVYCFKNISLNTTQSSCQNLCFAYFTDWSVYMTFTYGKMAWASEK